MRRLAPLLVLALLALPVVAQAPAGFRTFNDADTGLSLYWPTSYTQIPLEPTESVLKARWRRSRLPAEMEGMNRVPMPELAAFLFTETGGTTPSNPEADDEAPAGDSGPRTIREAMERNADVGSFTEFLQKKLGAFATGEVDEHEGHFELTPRKDKNGRLLARGDLRGYLIRKREGTRVYGIYGLTLEPHFERLKAEMVVMLRGLDLPQAGKAEAALARETEKWTKHYERKNLKGAERRIAVRLSTAAGWKAEDTENYIIVHHSKNTKLIARIKRDIEAMRELYASLFPAVAPVETVSVVRVCRNREEYLAYGGSANSGGFWHPGNEELVFYDYRQDLLDNEAAGRDPRRKTSDQDSLLVLYHEAFHQYIFYAVGEVSPHYWFNEGHGDFFSGAVMSRGGKVLRVGPSWWRFHRAKDQMEAGKGRVPLKDLLHADRRIYYNPQNASNFYTAGWSFVYFMRQSKVVEEHEVWSTFLDRYFDTLKAEYASEVAKRGEAPNLAEKNAAQEAARVKAIAKALEGVQLDELEEAWERFILEERDPWPHLRKK